jgi:hypothetical protein
MGSNFFCHLLASFIVFNVFKYIYLIFKGSFKPLYNSIFYKFEDLAKMNIIHKKMEKILNLSNFLSKFLVNNSFMHNLMSCVLSSCHFLLLNPSY